MGGMGVVYRVRHRELHADFALKMLRPEYAENSELVIRFQHEARIMARMHHPNIVRVTDIDQDGSQYYFVMEYVAGRNLHQILQEDGPPPLSEVLRISEQTARALDHAHTRDKPVIHRDVKPSNIMIEQGTGRVVLTDFGIAKLADPELTRMTLTGRGVGTVRYCSPEQMRGVPDLDARADIYSLGLVMYEALTGRRFFNEGTEEAVIGHVLNDTQENEPQFDQPVPASFRRLIKRAIAKDRDRRYPRMATLLADLQAVAAETAKSAVRKRIWFALPVLAVASLGVVLGVAVWTKWPALPEEDDSPRLAVTTPTEERLEIEEQQELEFSVEGSEGIQSYKWYLDDAGPVASGLRYVYRPEPGEGGQKHKVHVVATGPNDKSIQREWEIAVASANHPPELAGVMPEEEQVIAPRGSVTFRADGQDQDGDTLTYAWLFDGQARDETSPEISLAGLEVGTHEVVAVVRDAADAEVRHRWSVQVPSSPVKKESAIEPIPAPITEPEPQSVDAAAPIPTELKTVPLADSITIRSCEAKTFSVKNPEATDYQWSLDGKLLSATGPQYRFEKQAPGEHRLVVSAESDAPVARKEWTVTVLPTPPIEDEVNRWVAAYQKALEQKDLVRLRELGYLRSADEHALGEKLERRDDFRVRVRNLKAKAQGSHVHLVFERVDTWNDPRSYSAVFDYTTENVVLTRHGCGQIVAVK